MWTCLHFRHNSLHILFCIIHLQNRFGSGHGNEFLHLWLAIIYQDFYVLLFLNWFFSWIIYLQDDLDLDIQFVQICNHIIIMILLIYKLDCQIVKSQISNLKLNLKCSKAYILIFIVLRSKKYIWDLLLSDVICATPSKNFKIQLLY